MNIKDLEQIVHIVRNSDISEFELDQDGTHLRIARGVVAQGVAVQAVPQASIQVQPAIVGGSAGHAPASSGANEDLSHLVKVESPIVGTFYRRPSPDAESYVSEGTVVKKGDTLCIIEAMKLMNEIEAPCEGRIERICLSDGKVVEFGEVLFLINPTV